MANRPIVYRFVYGKGRVKRRQESDDTARAVVEQVSISFADQAWRGIATKLKEAVLNDVRAELIHVAGEFRRHVIGAPSSQRGLVGTLKTRARSESGGQVSQSLGSLPRWAPRGARYLEEKKVFAGHHNWFDNTGWTPNGGTLAEFFQSQTETTDGGSAIHVGSAGILEEMFGGISVEIRRNNKGFGSNAGTIKVGKGNHIQMQLATINVRALGKVTDRMLQISSQPNTAMLNVIGAHSQKGSIAALHLRGGRGRYRPTLEPYLKFFLERAIPQAVSQRIAKGTAAGRLFR